MLRFILVNAAYVVIKYSRKMKNRYLSLVRRLGRNRVMCSLYHLDSYKREYIELSRYKGESRGGFADFLRTSLGTGDAHA